MCVKSVGVYLTIFNKFEVLEQNKWAENCQRWDQRKKGKTDHKGSVGRALAIIMGTVDAFGGFWERERQNTSLI